MVIDLSLSAVSRGQVSAALDRGEPLGEGQAFDSDGRPTLDPAAALEGALAPLGGAKGFALGLLIESLTAVLAGPHLSADVPALADVGPGPGEAGHRPHRHRHCAKLHRRGRCGIRSTVTDGRSASARGGLGRPATGRASARSGGTRGRAGTGRRSQRAAVVAREKLTSAASRLETGAASVSGGKSLRLWVRSASRSRVSVRATGSRTQASRKTANRVNRRARRACVARAAVVTGVVTAGRGFLSGQLVEVAPRSVLAASR